MRLFPERWTIDYWPLRLIVSVYLLTTGALLAAAITFVGFAMQAAAVVAAAATAKVFGALLLLRPEAQARPAQVSLTPYLAGSVAVAAVFLAATVLMWTRVRWRWVAAAVAALIAGAAWWLLAYAVLTQPQRHPSLASATLVVAVTAMATLGALAATLQRAPGEGDAAS
ncbi:MAG TPA: hypothetical protein VKT30_03865 [Caulobacteraceae bacterium]|nr:hypothetical protein [Caulobacteraceae bacterium]